MYKLLLITLQSDTLSSLVTMIHTCTMVPHMRMDMNTTMINFPKRSRSNYPSCWKRRKSRMINIIIDNNIKDKFLIKVIFSFHIPSPISSCNMMHILLTVHKLQVHNQNPRNSSQPSRITVISIMITKSQYSRQVKVEYQYRYQIF